jgi:tetratricopeptide (TPR) repeat protein
VNRRTCILFTSSFLLFALLCATPARAQRPTPDELAHAEAGLKAAEAAYGPDSGTPNCSTPAAPRALTDFRLSPADMLESALRNLSILYIGVYRYDDSEALARRAFALWDACPGPARAQGTPRWFAQVLELQGKFAEAEPVWRRLLQFIEEQGGPNGNTMFIPLEELAKCLTNQGKFPEAEQAYQRALKIGQFSRQNSWIVPQALTALAELAVRQKHYTAAEEAYLRVQPIQEKEYGAESPAAVENSFALARVYAFDGKYEDTEKLYRRGLDIMEKNKKWPRTMNLPSPWTALEGLSDVYLRQGKFAEAQQICMRGAPLSCTVHVYRASGKLAEAATYQERIVTTSTKNGITLFLVNDLHVLARIYAEMGRFAEAEPPCRRAREIRESFSDPVYGWGPNQPEIVPILETCAFILQKLDRGAEADKLSARAAEIRAKFPFHVPPKQTP